MSRTTELLKQQHTQHSILLCPRGINTQLEDWVTQHTHSYLKLWSYHMLPVSMMVTGGWDCSRKKWPCVLHKIHAVSGTRFYFSWPERDDCCWSEDNNNVLLHTHARTHVCTHTNTPSTKKVQAFKISPELLFQIENTGAGVSLIRY